MNHKPLLLSAVALLLAAGLWLAFANDEATPLPGGPDTAVEPTAPAANTESRGGAITDATAQPGEAAGARDAVTVHEALLPIPDDANWTEVRVIDKATGEPIPGATVYWSDGGVREAMQEQALVVPDDHLTWRDHEVLAGRFGWRTTSDGDGIARVHRTEDTEVSARHGSLYGRRNLGEVLMPPRDGFRIELEPDHSIIAEVLDASGRPAIRVPVAVAVHNDKGEFRSLLNWGAMSTSEAPDGIARLTHVQGWRNQIGAGSTARLRTYIPGFDDPGVELDLDALPETAVTLRLPPCGKVRVRVELNGEPTVADSYTLQEHLPTRNRPMARSNLTRAPDPDGWARFEHLPLGKTLNAYAQLHGGYLHRVFAGPMSDGAEVSVTLGPQEGEIMLSGRVLDAGRAPLANQKIQLRVRGRIRHESDLETDADGRFLAIVGKVRKQNDAESIEVYAQPDGQRPLRASAAPRELRAGIEDLGDLALELEPLVVAGRCEIDGEPAMLPERTRIERYQVREGREPRWQTIGELRKWRAEDGAFEFRGIAARDRMRIMVRDQKLVTAEPIEFAFGAEDVVVRLTRGGNLAATMLMPADTHESLTVTMTPAAPVAGAAAAAERRARVWSREDGRQQASWTGVGPGTYDIAIMLSGVVEPVWTVKSVKFPGADPRLVDIDLRDCLRMQTIRLVDNTGAPIRRTDGGVFPLGQDPAGDMIGFPLHRSEWKVMMPATPVDLLVGIVGYRPQQVRADGEPIEVRLDPWPTATLTLPELPPLPEQCQLQASLAKPQPGARRWRAQWRSGYVSELYGPPTPRVVIENGTVALPVGDEPRRIQLHVYHRRRGVAIEIPPQLVSLTTPTLRVQVTAEAVKKAADAAMKQDR